MPNELVQLFSLVPFVMPGKKRCESLFMLLCLLQVTTLECPDTLLLPPLRTSGRWCSISIIHNSEVLTFKL